MKIIEIALSFNKNVIISTGLLNFKEANKIIKKITKKFKTKKKLEKISFLHCVSSYPASYENANLKRISKFKEKWKNIRFGYSDHTLGIEASIASRVLGAEIIEKHFTFNKKFSDFRDHSISADLPEMKKLVLSIKELNKWHLNFQKSYRMTKIKILK